MLELSQLGDSIMLLENAQSYLSILLGVSAGVLVFLWLAIIIWSLRDIRSRSRSTLASIFTVFLVAVFPIVGLAVYLLLRPRETLAAQYDRALEQEVLLQQIETKPTCPTCSSPTQVNWFLCPSCHTHLRQPCPVCNSPLELHWDICPYCGYLFPPVDDPLQHDSAEVEPSTAEEQPYPG